MANRDRFVPNGPIPQPQPEAVQMNVWLQFRQQRLPNMNDEWAWTQFIRWLEATQDDLDQEEEFIDLNNHEELWVEWENFQQWFRRHNRTPPRMNRRGEISPTIHPNNTWNRRRQMQRLLAQPPVHRLIPRPP